MMRLLPRVLHLWLVTCLLVGFLGVPSSGPRLLCRMTGMPMAPVMVPERTAKTVKTCCAVRAHQEEDTVHYSLVAPGCCDLKVANSHPKAPALLTAVELPTPTIADAQLPVPVPTFVAVVAPRFARLSAGPRAPPWRSGSPRAPPFFS